MLNIKLLYSFLFLFMATVLFSSCIKIEDPETDPNDPNFTALDIHVDINMRPEARYYLVIENPESLTKYFPMNGNFNFTFSRGTSIIGNTFNLHFIKIDELVDGTIEIKSFFDAPVGSYITIGENNFKKVEASESTINLNFINIPDFDIVSRTAKSQEQCFTQTTFSTPATTPELGGETYEYSQIFYACFQKENNAVLRVERLLSGTSDYTIDFTNLRTDLTRHSFSKNIGNASILHADVKAWSNPHRQFKPTEIFNLDNFDIYPSSTFDIFTPDNQLDLRYFEQNLRYGTSESIYNNWAFSVDLNTEFDIIDVGLKTTSKIGQLPLIETTSENYDEVQIVFESDNFNWTMHGSSSGSFYIPLIPKEIYDYFPEGMNLSELFLSQEKGIVKLIDYSNFNNYVETLQIYLIDQKLELESSYITQEQEFTIK